VYVRARSPAVGSIPARAGKPAQEDDLSAEREVHPRSARGNPGLAEADVGAVGCIPARAGKASLIVVAVFVTRVHPRARGQTPYRARPIVRRCIPTRAGKPAHGCVCWSS